MPLTLLGVTFLVFCVTRFVPGGPVEQMMQKQAMGAISGQKATSQQGESNLNEGDMEKLEEQFGLQESIGVAYLQWVGMLPKKIHITKSEYLPNSNTTDLILSESGRSITAPQQGEISYADGKGDPKQDGWEISYESPQQRAERWGKRMREHNPEILAQRAAGYLPRAIAYKTQYSGLLQGTMGNSFKYNEPVWDMILERIPISLYFGILSAIITYSICIPLGIFKAIHHKTWFNNISSITIFLGYSIPGFALGAVLVVYLGARLEWFPLSGLTSANFESMDFFDQVKDLAHHTVLPLICYVISSFAITTMMMKNNLMENLSADYIRTAMAKGVSFRNAVYRHAFRNSFIPIATSLGALISVVIAGSMLIEQVFDIQGFGMLSYQSLMDKDYSLIMGTLLLASFLMILGNLLSDIIVALVDPRVQFK